MRDWRHSADLATAASYACVAAYLCFQRSVSSLPVTIDNQLYFFVADRVSYGVPPHVSLVDHKHALSAILSGWTMATARTLGSDVVLAGRVLSIGFAGASVAGVWLLSAKLSGKRIHAHLSALTMLAFSDFFFQASMGYRPKVIMVVFIVGALLAYAHRRFLIAGIAGACAFLCWQPAGVLLAGIAAAASLGPRPRETVGSFVVGAAATLLAYESYFLFHGVIGEQLYQAYGMRADVSLHHVPSVGESVNFLVALGLAHREVGARLIGVTFLATFVVTGLRALIRPRHASQLVRGGSPWVGFGLSCAGAVMFTMIDHQAYPDMFLLHPFIAVTVGGSLAAAIEYSAGMGGSKYLLRAGLLALCVIALSNTVLARRALFPAQGLTRSDQETLAKHADLLADEHGSIWAIGCVHLLAYLHRDNHSMFGMFLDPRVGDYALQSGNGMYLPLKDGTPPGVILVARSDIRVTMPWLDEHYILRPHSMFKEHGIAVWLRRTSAFHAG